MAEISSKDAIYLMSAFAEVKQLFPREDEARDGGLASGLKTQCPSFGRTSRTANILDVLAQICVPRRKSGVFAVAVALPTTKRNRGIKFTFASNAPFSKDTEDYIRKLCELLKDRSYLEYPKPPPPKPNPVDESPERTGGGKTPDLEGEYRTTV